MKETILRFDIFIICLRFIISSAISLENNRITTENVIRGLINAALDLVSLQVGVRES